MRRIGVAACLILAAGIGLVLLPKKDIKRLDCFDFVGYAVLVEAEEGEYEGEKSADGETLNLSPYFSKVTGDRYLLWLNYKIPDGRFAERALKHAEEDGRAKLVAETEKYIAYDVRDQEYFVLKPADGTGNIAVLCVYERVCQIWVDYDSSLQIRLTGPRTNTPLEDAYRRAQEVRAIVKGREACARPSDK